MRPRKQSARENSFSKIRDARAEGRLFTRRALIAGAGVLLLLLLLVGRLVYLQVLNHEHFITLAEDNRVKILPLPPTRGLIFDRNGVLLADNLPSYRLEITPEDVPDLGATLGKLAELVQLEEPDMARFRRLLRRNPSYRGLPLRFKLSDHEVAQLAVNLHRLPGVNIKADLTRFYPHGTHAVHAVGYVGRIDEQELQRVDGSQYSGTSHIGKIGAEKAYEDLLHGRVGHQRVETNAEGRVLRVLESVAPAPGKNIYLTIDSHLQTVAEQALAESGHNGAIVALDPRNGEILAMASMPVYEPNPFVNGIDVASYKALNTSPDRPLFNRALRGNYPPGSTIKPFVALAGLETGTISRGARTYCPGFYRLPGNAHRFRDWKRGGHGHTDVDKAIHQSCDVFFYTLAHDMGMERLHDYLDQFNLGRSTGVDLRDERTGLLPSPQWKRRVYGQPWYPGETLIAGIGQGYMLTTPLQLASATAAIANYGKHFKPRILHALEDQATLEKTLEPPRPLPNIPVSDRANWDDVITGMIHVTHGERGTARAIGKDAPYRMAGKTGTAQVFSLGQEEEYDAEKLDKKLHDHALFIAFAPVEDPRIAVAVIAEHGGGGSSTAAPLARRVLDAWLVPTATDPSTLGDTP